MTELDTWLAVLHVVGGSVWVGCWAAICVVAADVVRAPTSDAVRRLLRLMRVLGPAVIGPSTVAVLVAGVALVLRQPWVDMSDLWIVLGLVAYAIVTALGILGLGRTAKRATAALDRDDLASAASEARRWYRLALVVTAILILATVDMVLKV